MSHVVFVLLPEVHLLDVAGPAQVFGTAADFGQPYRLSYVAEREQAFRRELAKQRRVG